MLGEDGRPPCLVGTSVLVLSGELRLIPRLDLRRRKVGCAADVDCAYAAKGMRSASVAARRSNLGADKVHVRSEEGEAEDAKGPVEHEPPRDQVGNDRGGNEHVNEPRREDAVLSGVEGTRRGAISDRA